MKKLITFLFDYTIIGWSVIVCLFVLSAIILLAPYLERIQLFIIRHIDMIFPTIILSIIIYYVGIHIASEWKKFNETYNN